jgi:hypothetical protein
MSAMKGISHVFDWCAYRELGDASYTSAAFDNSMPTDTLDVTPQGGNRPPEWGIYYIFGQDRFWIWDKVPFQRGHRQLADEDTKEKE